MTVGQQRQYASQLIDRFSGDRVAALIDMYELMLYNRHPALAFICDVGRFHAAVSPAGIAIIRGDNQRRL